MKNLDRKIFYHNKYKLSAKSASFKWLISLLAIYYMFAKGHTNVAKARTY